MADRNEDDTREVVSEGVGGVAGAATGAALGSLAGPLGTVIGGIAGAVGGWWTGKAAADAVTNIDSSDEEYYRQQFTSTAGGGDYDAVRPAYHLGHVAGFNPEYESRSFDEIEPHLRAGWNNDVESRSGRWEDVRGYARNAFQRGQERRLTLSQDQLAMGTGPAQDSEVSMRTGGLADAGVDDVDASRTSSRGSSRSVNEADERL